MGTADHIVLFKVSCSSNTLGIACSLFRKQKHCALLFCYSVIGKRGRLLEMVTYYKATSYAVAHSEQRDSHQSSSTLPCFRLLVCNFQPHLSYSTLYHGSSLVNNTITPKSVRVNTDILISG